MDGVGFPSVTLEWSSFDAMLTAALLSLSMNVPPMGQVFWVVVVVDMVVYLNNNSLYIKFINP